METRHLPPISVVGFHGGAVEGTVERVRRTLPQTRVLSSLADDLAAESALVILVVGAFCPVNALAAAVSDVVERAGVLVVLDSPDDALGLAAMRAGADDWIAADLLEPEVMIQRILERRRAASEHQLALDSTLRAEEADRLDKMVGGTPTPTTARTFGSRPLREGLPEVFASAVLSLNTLIDQAIDERIFGPGAGTDAGLRALADSLGFARASPRDVIDLYVTMLRGAEERPTPRRQALAAEEGRLIALQLMGHLVTHYRLRVIGAPGRTLGRGRR
ncbi:transcriptional regulator [Rhodospirillum rubrum]|uniref:Two-component response regulator (NarL subfamily) n=1 Tax=Rhodospirillum rubrum (strain ATCC 11170 / ATH 1.1.1 / DSM 467 / LMG 4362 / NCIMB 8255 / S1) TaxID=269796 RepID=Q2RP57_RHORT|nr:transcriptional regulator [Rhodospirillum rubrum]ABC24088.1 two-component response regulator (NarL subfamily) [Rhodospirillum rubrum ATCC 11170]AEO49834.1 NarL family two-component response regulator [Rhodospirillum rubrum F11]MBK5955773.1 NarL family two-protein response regulator [Rhodospirillum rubrum]QXG80030.1 NarL family two-protein response regulator [Rhodospirillum rubrum]